MRLYRRLFLPDTHTPDHDKKAWKIVQDVAQDFQPDEIVVGGDFFDCEPVSQYTKDPKAKILLEDDLAIGRDVLFDLERRSKCKSMVFLQGNHEERIDRYIAKQAPAFAGLDVRKDILKLPDYYRWFPYGRRNKYFMANGRLMATHGTLYNKHVCAAMLAKYPGTSVIFFHTHRFGEAQTVDVHGNVRRAINSGWLGDKSKATYVKDNDEWCHGITLGWFHPNTDRFWLQPVAIVNDQAVVGGKLYSGAR